MKRHSSYLIELYQKNYEKDGKGGHMYEWKSLGHTWAEIMPCAAAYEKSALDKPWAVHQKMVKTYEASFRYDDRLFKINKIIWQKKHLFPSHSPHRITHPHTRIKIRFVAPEQEYQGDI